MMGMTTYGYIRVSGTDQNEDRQILAMRELGIPPERIYTDKQSGKDFDRPAYNALIRRLEPGDLLYVLSIDRLGRDYEEIQNQWRRLTKSSGVDIAVIDMPLLDTRAGKDLMGTFLTDIVLQILSFVAQNEREAIRKRQSEGIAAARIRGIHLGRPFKNLPDGFAELAASWERGEITGGEMAARSGIPKSTLYRRLKQIRVKTSVPKGKPYETDPNKNKEDL
jgi:DNA invertase Pin-like site-specific DNA recombinase